jgi:hypothetical protein
MKMMVIVKATAASEAGEMPSHELLAAMGSYNEQLVEAGIMRGGDGLRPSSYGKRVRFHDGGSTVIDGPFAETRELVAGFWLWEVRSMAEALEWIRKAPFTFEEVELWPFAEADDFGEAFTPELREQEERLRARSGG